MAAAALCHFRIFCFQPVALLGKSCSANCIKRHHDEQSCALPTELRRNMAAARFARFRIFAFQPVALLDKFLSIYLPFV